MNAGKYIFSQMTAFLPKRYFERLVERVDDKTKKGFVWPTGPYEARRCTLRLQYYGDFALF